MQQCPYPPQSCWWPCWSQCPSTRGAEDGIWPFSLWEEAGLSLCPFPATPPVSTQLAPGAVGPAAAMASELPPLHAAIQRAGSHGSHVPPSPAARAPALCAEGTWAPAASPSSTRAGSPWMQYRPSRSCRTQGAPKPSPHFWGSLACTPNYLRPWGPGAAWGSQWQWGLGDSSTALSLIHLSLLYLSQAWAEGPCNVPSDCSW